MFKIGHVVACLLLVLLSGKGAWAFPNYDNAASSQSGYGTTTKCTPYEETVFVDRCESYNDEVCYTTQQDQCTDIQDQTCRAIVTGHQTRQCFNVTELICGLREQVQFEVINAVFTVQRCHKVSERVCDTVYDIAFSTKDDFQCMNVQNNDCSTEESTVYDETCQTTTKFDCNFVEMASSYGNSYSSSASGNSGSAAASSGDGYGNAGPSSSGSGYGSETSVSSAPRCVRKQEKKCYENPRQVTKQTCSQKDEKVCEKMSERVPFPEERQVCHNEEKKVCELEQKTKPKQIKKYVYTKQCRSVPKVVCENADQKKLVPSCVPTNRKKCETTPSKRCEDIPKQHCYKVPTKVRRERCETVPAYSGGVQSQSSSGYDN